VCDTFDELMTNPMAKDILGPFNGSFESIFTQFMEKTPEEIVNQELTLPEDDEEYKQLRWMHELIQTIVKATKTFKKEEHMSVKLTLPSYLIGVKVDVNSHGIGKALELALMVSPFKNLVRRHERIQEDKQEQEN